MMAMSQNHSWWMALPRGSGSIHVHSTLPSATMEWFQIVIYSLSTNLLRPYKKKSLGVQIFLGWKKGVLYHMCLEQRSRQHLYQVMPVAMIRSDYILRSSAIDRDDHRWIGIWCCPAEKWNKAYQYRCFRSFAGWVHVRYICVCIYIYIINYRYIQRGRFSMEMRIVPDPVFPHLEW